MPDPLAVSCAVPNPTFTSSAAWAQAKEAQPSATAGINNQLAFLTMRPPHARERRLCDSELTTPARISRFQFVRSASLDGRLTRCPAFCPPDRPADVSQPWQQPW